MKFWIFFLQKNCLCDHALSPDFLSLLYLVPRYFYLSRNQNKKHLILLEGGPDVKARCLFQDHCVGSQANILCGFVWKRVLKSLQFPLTPQTHQPISNSTQLCSDQWNPQLGFLTKFGHEVITGINTCCKVCPDGSLSYEVWRKK